LETKKLKNKNKINNPWFQSPEAKGGQGWGARGLKSSNFYV
jgi:hypothetical protein